MNAARHLLALRGEHGHWEGELSSSALSTATAVFALGMVDRNQFGSLIERGFEWLAGHVNADGGWGDTVVSESNISTTVLVWAAFSLAGESGRYQGVVAGAEGWLVEKAGGLAPWVLARAIAGKYGDDNTFSAPILTMCALSGRFGTIEEGMQRVTALPFELGIVPHRLLKWLRLPVVSYALPALIAIGQVRDFFVAPENPWVRLIRRKLRAKTLSVLWEMQPLSGGYLEATPITSFVVMSLAGMGLNDHPVAEQGVKFLTTSMRADGSWPVDTNLATWVTSLSVKALGSGGGVGKYISETERKVIAEWLMDQQHRRVHAYTQAEPGGWAWTDLSGGVPDADDTAGALIALHNLVQPSERVVQSVMIGIRWLMQIQNRDGGMPTFCAGWGKLPFDRSAADLTAHAIAAMSMWWDDLPSSMYGEMGTAIEEAFIFLLRTQGIDGSWAPLWFGNEGVRGQENPTYGTGQVLSGIIEAAGRFFPEAAVGIDRGVRWLLRVQNSNGGWGGAAGVASSVEETAVAIGTLGKYWGRGGKNSSVDLKKVKHAIEAGIDWLGEKTEEGARFEPSPIGLYFAKLWYYERLYPVIFTVGALEEYGKCE
ncbi:MAG: squalene--hopene cyclase [Planctomycetes bacterium]|nr:squalene--hopene cyclase [Planctomycetota bacterium]